MAASPARERPFPTGADSYTSYLAQTHQRHNGRTDGHPYLPPEAVANQHALAALVVERVTESHGATVFSYEPYIDYVRGTEGNYPIASQYTRVIMSGQEAWFETVRPTETTPLRSLDFITTPRLDLILGNTQSPEAARFEHAIANPRSDHAIVRLVEHEEEPLPSSGYPRMTDAKSLSVACDRLVEHIRTGQPRPIRRKTMIQAHMPSLEDLSRFTEQQTTFLPLYTAGTGVTIGEGRAITAHLHREDNETSLLFLYPTRAEDGAQATLISTHPLDRESVDMLPTQAEGRLDFYCSCQKHGTRAAGHSCAHELLGALQAATAPGKENDLTVFAHGGQDAKGKGPLAHSAKPGNLERLDQLPSSSGRRRRRPSIPENLSQFPYAEYRPFHHLAQALGAALELVGITDLTVQTGNKGKMGALQAEISRLQASGQPITVDFFDAADIHVPESILARDVVTRRADDPTTYAN